MTTNNKHRCSFTVDETIALALRGRPLAILKTTEPMYRELAMIPTDERNMFVLERDTWNVGYDTILLPPLPEDEYRLWNRKDWENCDNRNKQAVARLNLLHEQRIAERAAQRQAVKDSLVKSGVTSDIADMLVAAYNDDQIVTLHATVVKQGQ